MLPIKVTFVFLAIMSLLTEKHGDRMSRMANGDIDEFKTTFTQGCPKVF